MKKIIDWVSGKLSLGVSEALEAQVARKRYGSFHRILRLVMLGVFLVPLLITTSLSYYQYRTLLQQDELANLRQTAESTKRTIETFIKELHTVLIFTSSLYSYEELLDQERLTDLFHRIETQYPGIVDLGIIDHTGIQRAYTGPYDLLGLDYGDRDCYLKTIIRKTYIGPVVMGYRGVPHFCMAVSNRIPGTNRQWIFRTSIDVETLNRYLAKTSIGPAGDAFLVTSRGEPLLQSSSRYHGDALTPYPLTTPPGRSGITITEMSSDSSPPRLKATAHLEGTPWMLVLLKPGYIYGANWSRFKLQLSFILLASTIMALAVIQRTTSLLMAHIRQSDEKREALLSEMEHTSKLASVGRLAAGVAHEINNPLAIISEKAGLIEDLLNLSGDFKNKERISVQIGGVAQAVERCKVITHRLLGFARRMDVSLESINLNNLLLEVWGFLDKEALYRGAQLEVALADDLPAIKSDRGLLQQIFLNLLNNALDAIDHEGMISITTRQHSPGAIEVAIADNGSGIPPEIIKHIFEPFFTTKTGTDKKGTGLGLSITYGLVQKLGGKISVESAPEMGTIFRVILPTEQQESRRRDHV